MDMQKIKYRRFLEMIDPEKVAQISNIFVGHFINMNTAKDAPNFLELLLGLMYACEKIMGALEALNILSQEHISKIRSEMGKSFKEDVDLRLKAILERKED